MTAAATTLAATLAACLAGRLHAELVETHISWVLLTPTDAWKLKKPVRLPFVDYSTLDKRRHFCKEEVRLNRRLARGLYLGVARITGTAQAPVLEGDGDAIEYAVHMRRFPAGALFSEQLEAGTLAPAAVDGLAELLSDFHTAAPGGAPLQPLAPRDRALAALAGARALYASQDAERLHRWIESAAATLAPVWAARRAAGFVRECHGDLHLANIVSLDGVVAAFDCIEFDPALRWIDVVEDIAFPVMDFAARGHADHAFRLLDRWLERTGDFGALPLLPFALAYRALVRAQVENMRAAGGPAATRYAGSALRWIAPAAVRLVITHGLPGSGKTFASQQLLEREGAVRIRSDVERKRLAGLGALEDSRARGLDLYSGAATARTYERLFELARTALGAGFPVVLDAAFLRRAERAQAAALARELGVPFAILDCRAPLAVLQERLRRRRGDASEADVAVLEQLRGVAEPLMPEERAARIAMDAASGA